MQPAITLRQKLAGNQPVLGLLCTEHIWPQLIDVAMAGGLDYLIIDSEHHPHEGSRVAEVCACGRMAGFPVLLRPPHSDQDSVRMALDLGPCGLLLPSVSTAEQLDDVREGSYMPPRGDRRPGGAGNRWLRTFNYESFKSVVEDHLIVIPQIEDVEGLNNAEQIANHELTTALGIGPFDLSAQLGVCGSGVESPPMAKAVDRLHHAATSAGKPMWVIGDAGQWVERGFRFICAGEVSYFLQFSLKTLTSQLQNSLPD